ncbi:hypothetical protein COHA_006486 [Chlorella ohadii]|uniref:tRNA dimethylallyltransferase n=1 Tax=Chlorella ohadii TaxID=2649997 RepID=A0AAD5H535_9CHLO|nr:hypothetical protein COHA_006486 [Chlorella ohadii]
MHAANAASARLLHLPTNRLAALRALAGARRGAAVMAAPAASGGAAAAAADGPASAAAGARPKVLVLTGPTAVGKTKASLALAEALGGEIISADSVQVYRRLDIGSDKIRPEEQRGIPHHLIDVLDPEAEFSAGDFFTLARAAAEDILRRGRTPIVVGGTGFYLRWFIHGKPATPGATPASEAAARERLEQAYAAAAAAAAGKAPADLAPEERWAAGCALIESLGDAVSAERLRGEPNNQYRLLRVVDILLQTGGRTLAELDLDAQRPTDYDCRCFFLHRPRAELYRRIDGRVEEMMAGGLLTECQEVLLDAGIQPNSNCASRAIGYRQAGEALQRWHADPDSVTEQSVIQAVQAVQAASRQLCHKQMTWFRDEEMFRWIDATQGEEAVLAEILQRWAAPAHEGGCGDSGRLT